MMAAERITHRRPVLPEPDCPDPRRRERIDRHAGTLIRREIAAQKAAMTREARATAARAIAGTDGGAAAARPEPQQVATETAGETAAWRADAYLIDHCRSTGVLTPRQCDAAEALARDRSMCFPHSWRRRGHGTEPEDGTQAAARERYDAMLEAAPYATRSVLATFALGEWPIAGAETKLLLQVGLDAVADHLRLPV